MPPPEVSDAQLIARALVGDDRHAFTELVRRHQSTVRACLRKAQLEPLLAELEHGLDTPMGDRGVRVG